MRIVVCPKVDLTDTVSALALRARTFLCQIAGQGTPVTYHALAKALELVPPNTIQQLTVALERLIEEDAVAGRPLIAALVVGKARVGLPGPGFFECAQRVGRFDGDTMGADGPAFFAAECDAAAVFWHATTLVAEADGTVLNPL